MYHIHTQHAEVALSQKWKQHQYAQPSHDRFSQYTKKLVVCDVMLALVDVAHSHVHKGVDQGCGTNFVRFRDLHYSVVARRC